MSSKSHLISQDFVPNHSEVAETAEEIDRFFELSIDMLCIAGTDAFFKRLNPAFTNILGYELRELMTKPYYDFVHPDDLEATIQETEKLKQGIPTIEFENRYRCKNGTYKWISWHCMPHHSGALYAVARDVSAEKEIQKTLRQSLREKEVLLKEIHHRVKNNLQVISSLINMQIRKLDDISAKDALTECQSRIQAIALIHEKLYQSADYAKISFAEYVKSLVNDIFQASGASTNTIALEFDIMRSNLAIDKAIPCALVINELVTNSIKHAFPNYRRGVISIKMYFEDDRYFLKIHDNGIGIPEGLHLKEPQSLGLQLVCILVEQLKGKINFHRDSGTYYTIQFDR
jgi:PAS domain S-box-containing protein